MKKTDCMPGQPFGIAGLLLTLLILGGCGLKDDLYIPSEEAEVTATDEQNATDPDTDEEVLTESGSTAEPAAP